MFSAILVFCCVSASSIATQFDWPVYPKDNYRCDQDQFEYNPDHSGYHLGEDWNGKGGMSTDKGNPVYCVANGRVVKVDNTELKNDWGKVIVVAHTLPSLEIVYSVYTHLQKILVSKGQDVLLGKQIGTIGDANGYYLNAAHLHFAIMKRGPFPPKAKGYVKELYLDTADDYYIPSLFISNRQNPTVISLNSGSWKNFTVVDQTPISTAYVEVKNRVTGSNQYHSFTEALTGGTLKPVIKSSGPAGVLQVGPSQLPDFIFMPNGTKYALKSVPASSLYQVSLILFPIKVDEETMALRAKSDMLCSAYAYGPEFISAFMNTFRFETLTWPDGSLLAWWVGMGFETTPGIDSSFYYYLSVNQAPLIGRWPYYDIDLEHQFTLPRNSPNKVD